MVEFCSPSKSKRGGSQRERSFAMLGFTHYFWASIKPITRHLYVNPEGQLRAQG